MRYALLALLAVASGQAFADDPLPEGAVARFGSTRFQDFTIGGSVAFSLDGKRLATGGANSPVCIWDAATGKLVRTHNPVGSILDLKWKADGKLATLAFFGHHGVFMHEWTDARDDGPSVEQIREMREAADKVKREGYRGHVFLSVDGRRVVFVWNTADSKRRAEVFTFAPNMPSSLVEPEWTVPLGNGYSVWLSRDAKTLIAHTTGAKREEERIAGFDLTAGARQDRPAWEFSYQSEGDHRVTHCLSADGKRVVLRFLNGDAELWDGPTGKLLRELPKIPSAYLPGGGEHPGIDLTSDGKRLAITTRQKSGEVGGSVIDLETGKELVALAAGSTPRLAGGFVFSPDGKKLALTSHGMVRVWDAETGADTTPLSGHRGRINSIVAAPDGKTVVTAGEDLTVRAWDPATGKEEWKVTFPQVVTVSFATNRAVFVEAPGGLAEPLLDLATGKARALPGAMGKGQKLPGTGFGGGEVVHDSLVALAPDGKLAVTLDNFAPPLGIPDTSLRVWSWPAGELKYAVSVEVPRDLRATRVRGRFTPDGKELWTVTWCRLAQPPISGPPSVPMLIDRWDAATGKRLERKETRDVYPVWTADGSRLLVVRDQGKIEDAFTGKTAGRLPHHNTDPFSVWTLGGMALSPDGKRIAIGGDFFHPGSVRVCDVQSGGLIATLPAGGRGRLEVAFLSDGRLVTAGESALVWAADATVKVKPQEKR